MVFTGEASYYGGLRADFPAGHFTVQHNIGEYVRGGAHVNGCENYFSILKRGINGAYQHVSPTHLKRYAGEFDFRYNMARGPAPAGSCRGSPSRVGCAVTAGSDRRLLSRSAAARAPQFLRRLGQAS